MIVFIIGHFHKMAVSYWSSALGEGALAKVFLKPVELIFPDLRLFNIVENIVGGQPVALTALAEMTGLSVLYAAVYTMIGLYLFIDKEF